MRHRPLIPPDRNALLTIPKVAIGVMAVLATAAFLWAYWPTFARLVSVWDTQPDYSHGYFVIPLAAYFLWARRDSFPGINHTHRIWPGVLLLLLAAAFRLGRGGLLP